MAVCIFLVAKRMRAHFDEQYELHQKAQAANA
jgi:hypothetical protein